MSLKLRFWDRKHKEQEEFGVAEVTGKQSRMAGGRRMHVIHENELSGEVDSAQADLWSFALAQCHGDVRHATAYYGVLIQTQNKGKLLIKDGIAYETIENSMMDRKYLNPGFPE